MKCSCSGFGAVLEVDRKVVGRLLILQPWSSSLCEPRWQRCRFGWLLVSRIIAGDDGMRTLADILTSWSRGNGRRSGGQFTATR
jgi:hypothetical protein